MRFYLIIILGFFLTIPGKAQNGKSSGFDPSNIFIGGNLNLSFSSNYTVIGGTPFIGYHFNEKLSGGIGITYIYQQWKTVGGSYEDSFYGGNLFGTYNITPSIFASTEFHTISTAVLLYDPVTESTEIGRKFVNMWYVGGGYRAPLGGRSYGFISILYDLIQDIDSPYNNPYIRAGFMVGF